MFSFETFQFAEIIDSFCTDAVWVGDINGDGNLDFVMGTMRNRSPRTSLLLLSPHQTKHLMLRILTMISWVYLGSNEGWSDSNRVCLPGAGTHPVFPADLNRDGFLDVFVGNLYYLFDSTFFDAIFFKDSPFDSIGT